MVQISRTNVIDGAADDTEHLGTVFHCGREVLLHEVGLTRAQVQALHTTAVVILPALVGSRKIAVLGVYYVKAAGAYSGGGTVSIHHLDTAGTLVGGLPSSQMRNAGRRDGWFSRAGQSGDPSTFAVPEAGLDVRTGSAYTGAGGDLSITVRYVEVV